MGTPKLTPVLKDDALYLGDNGRCLCGKHSGASAQYTGRDLSGQRVVRLTPKMQQQAIERYGLRFRCEVPSCTISVSP